MQQTSDNIDIQGKNKDCTSKKGRFDKMSNKMKFSVSIEDEFGNEEIDPITVEVAIPNYKEFNQKFPKF